MKKIRIFDVLACAALLAVQVHGAAQQPSDPPRTGYGYRAALDTITKAAFYKIALPPAILAHCKPDLADIRIAGKDDRYIPYVFRTDLPISSAEGFSEFPVLPPASDTSREIQIANWSSTPINSLLLYIRNIGDSWPCSISGSDDRKKWFPIKEHIIIEPATSDSIGYYIQRIGFPATNYHFFKIEPEHRMPLYIIRAGIATKHYSTGKYLDIPTPSITQKDSSNHHSYIVLSWPEPYITDRLDLEIGGPALYRRKMEVYSREYPYTPALNTVIDPQHHQFQIPSVRTRNLVIDISNEDNPPLIVKSAAAAQLQRYLLTWLQPGSDYHLLAGSSEAVTPVYDLTYFVDSLSQPPAELQPGPLQPISQTAPPPKAKDHSTQLLWTVILLILALLIFLSLKMLKSIPRSNNERK